MQAHLPVCFPRRLLQSCTTLPAICSASVYVDSQFVASLTSLGNVAWVRLSNEQVRFTIIPELGTQVWAVLSIETIFETYTIQSAAAHNTIHLEVPLQPLLRALRSSAQATSASIRLTKKDNVPYLCMTIVNNFYSSSSTSAAARPPSSSSSFYGGGGGPGRGPEGGAGHADATVTGSGLRERETIITQDIPVRVLSAEQVSGLHEPRCREPDVHITLPPLGQLKAVSDRFTKLALGSGSGPGGRGGGGAGTGAGAGAGAGAPKLELAATMHGTLRLGVATDALRIASTWTGLANPELDPGQMEGGAAGVAAHPSSRMRALAETDERAWARVRIDGRDWSRVLSVGRLGGRVIACVINDEAMVLYVYIGGPDEDGGQGAAGATGDESVLTYYVSSYSA